MAKKTLTATMAEGGGVMATAPRGLTKRDLRRMTRRWTIVVRETITRLAIPPQATLRDIAAGLQAVQGDIRNVQRITAPLDRARPAKKAVA